MVFYRLIEEGIEVLRIVSGYRDLEVLFEEDDPLEEYTYVQAARYRLYLNL